ncbi:hypothetical protein IGA_04821 [Bacillus cereus HuA3-9]|uniref:Uncharacterized protein n=1 Tax=Bacillus cereus HuA3-9 TaxID=1053205 RepID=R8CMI2_BACCE|nr:hypothetical protein IGA_04821 [Bacillus cereus HuA3-9]
MCVVAFWIVLSRILNLFFVLRSDHYWKIEYSLIFCNHKITTSLKVKILILFNLVNLNYNKNTPKGTFGF